MQGMHKCIVRPRAGALSPHNPLTHINISIRHNGNTMRRNFGLLITPQTTHLTCSCHGFAARSLPGVTWCHLLP